MPDYIGPQLVPNNTGPHTVPIINIIYTYIYISQIVQITNRIHKYICIYKYFLSFQIYTISKLIPQFQNLNIIKIYFPMFNIKINIKKILPPEN